MAIDDSLQRGDAVRGVYFDAEFAGTVLEVLTGYAGKLRVFVAVDPPVQVYGTWRETICCSEATGTLEKKTQKRSGLQLRLPIPCV